MNIEFNPGHLDIAAFAEADGELSGALSLLELPRLKDALRIDNAAPAPIAQWQASGEQHARRGHAPQVRLRLQVQALAPLECQRCLDTVDVPLDLDRQFQFAPNEDVAAQLDEQEEVDVLVLSRHFDLIELIEDELLMALPVVARHEACPRALHPAIDPALAPEGTATDAALDKPNPFAILAALKKGAGNDDGK